MQGTHSTKTKGEVAGTNKKPWPQKGTGRARQGSLRNPHFRGGGAAFGPKPHDHEHKMNKKERWMGLRSALAARFQEGKLVIADSLRPVGAVSDEKADDVKNLVKTKSVAQFLQAQKLHSVLLIDAEMLDNVALACRNLPYLKYLPQIGCNVYDILKYKEIVISVEGLRKLEERLIVKEKAVAMPVNAVVEEGK